MIEQSRHRLCVGWVSFVLVVGSTAPTASAQRPGSQFVPRPIAVRMGLERAWHRHLVVDPARSSVVRAAVGASNVYCMTDQSVVQAIDGESGASLWTTEVGQPGYPTLRIDSRGPHVAVASGSEVVVLASDSGREIGRYDVSTVPAVGPTLTDTRVYIPALTGLIESFLLPHETEEPSPLNARFNEQTRVDRETLHWKHHSVGRVETPLMTTQEHICWATDRGFFYVASKDSRRARFRVELQDPVIAPMASLPPHVFVATERGKVYAISEKDGSIAWVFAAGSLVKEALVALDKQMYVCCVDRGMYCLEAENGRQLWYAPGVAQFVAASPSRIYVLDDSMQLVALDRQTGTQAAKLALRLGSDALLNRLSDRIYLVSSSGLVQCLHEPGLPEPVRHPTAADSAAKAPEETGPGDSPPGSNDAPDDPLPADDGLFNEPPAR